MEESPLTSTDYILLSKKGECIDTLKGIKITLINDPEKIKDDFDKGTQGIGNQVITPNGDGENEGFVVPEKYTRSHYEFLVMNRYGDVVYRKVGYINGDFKGRNQKGHALPDGTYFYQINDLQKGIEKKGFITVLNSPR